MEQDRKDWCVTVLIIDDKSNEVFLIKKRKERKVIPGKEPFTIPNRWAMAGGRRDSGDKDEIATAARELKEEIGSWVGINPDLRVVEDEKDHKNVSFIGYPIGGKLKINREEVVDYRWFPIKVLEDPSLLKMILNDENAEMHPGHQRRACKLLQLRREYQRKN